MLALIWIAGHPAGIEDRSVVLGTPYTLQLGGESDFPCCCTLISWRPGQNSQLEKFLFRPPFCALRLSCLLHLRFELNMSKHRPMWGIHPPPKKGDPFAEFYISVSNTSFHSMSKVRNQNTVHDTVLSNQLQIMATPSPNILQTGFLFFFSATTAATPAPHHFSPEP